MTLSEFKTYIFKRTRTDATSFTPSEMIIQLNSSHRYYLSIIRDITDNFLPIDWTTTDLATGTLSPIFDSNFHELVPLRVSYQNCADSDRKNTSLLFNDLQILESNFKRFYGSRNYRICTMTIASPGLISRKNHGLQVGDRVIFSTSSALPTGLTANTWYWVISNGMTDDDFEVSATKTGSAVNTSGSQTGTHWFAVDKHMGFGRSNDSNK